MERSRARSGQEARGSPGSVKFRLPQTQSAALQAQTVLLVMEPPERDVEFLRTDEGQPVWPVNSREERVVLEEVAQLFGGSLADAQGAPGGAPAMRAETVVGIGRAEEEASLYAHLTGRRASEVNDVEGLSTSDPPAVVLYCGQELDRDLMQWLFLAPRPAQATGLIWGRDPTELRRQVLSSSCAAVLNGPVSNPHVVINAFQRGATNEPVSSSLEKLGAGAGILGLQAHSDGISQPISSGAALCRRAHSDTSQVGRAPGCVHTGFCSTLERPVEEAMIGGALISPRAIAARILINTGCHAAFLGSPAVDSGWSIFPELVANHRIGAILAVPTLSLTPLRPIENELAIPLRLGEPVGSALARFEENATIREIGYRFLLFGDPGVRGSQPTAGSSMIALDSASQQVRKLRVTLPPRFDSELAPGLEMLRNLASAIRPETRDKGLATSHELFSRMNELVEAHDVESAIQGRVGNRVRSAALAHLGTTKVRLFEAWELGGVVISAADDLVACPHCGWRERPKTVRAPDSELREFQMCPYCSDVEDVRLPRAVSLRFKPPQIVCKPLKPLAAWAAAIFVVGPSAKYTKMIPWPEAANGAPAESVGWPEDASLPSPSRIYVVWMDGLSISSACVPTGAPPSA